jgi:hypothetical protein
MIVDEHRMRGVIHEAGKFARDGIAGKQDAGLERLYLEPALAMVLIWLASPLDPKQASAPAFQPAPKARVVIGRDH